MRLLLAFVSLIYAASAFSQLGQSSELLLEALQSSSMIDRTTAAKGVYGAGISDERVYAQVALNLEQGLASLRKDSPNLDELAWHTKALASSGNMEYMPLIRRAVDSGIRQLSKHAKDAVKILENSAAQGRPYLEYSKVPILTEKQAESCKFVAQEPCKTSRAAEKCISHHQNKAARSGANAIMLMHSSSRSVGFGPFGGDTTMIANYYKCG